MTENKRLLAIRHVFIVFAVFLMLSGEAQSAEKIENVRWRLDAKAEAVLPASFRFMTDEFKNKPKSKVSRQGLSDLRCSASGEFSASGLSLLKEKLTERAGKNADIYIVDLRKESHGFINGEIPVSGHVERNWGNYNLSAKEVPCVEKKLLKSIEGKEITFIPMGNADIKSFSEVAAKVQSAETEDAIVKKHGLRYKRIFATDQAAPTDENIDEFMVFYKTLPSNAWLHFHCQAGHGRTTSFAVFYDILKNPRVSLDDIVSRQYALGGSNLFALSDKNDWLSEENRKRAEKVRKFYDYVQKNRSSNFKKSFSEWVNE